MIKSSWKLSVAAIAAVIVLSPNSLARGATADEVLSKNADSSTESAETEIPFVVLERLMADVSFDRIRSDASSVQIAEMKIVHSSQVKKDAELQRLSVESSTFFPGNRLLKAAVARQQHASQLELHRKWAEILTAEQRADILRRNRLAVQQAIHQAALQSTSGDYGYFADGTMDSLMIQHDALSVISRPAIQDQLELSSEQFRQFEELIAETDASADETVRLCIERLKQGKPEMPVAVTSPAWEQLNTDTLAVLSDDQNAKYCALMANPFEIQKVVKDPDEAAKPESMRLLMPHGSPRSISNRVVNGDVTIELDFTMRSLSWKFSDTSSSRQNR